MDSPVKIRLTCKTCGTNARGWPILSREPKQDETGHWIGTNDEWDLDLSEVYCPNEPSHHPDAPIEFEVWTSHA